MSGEWKDKTCEKCEYKTKGGCRRFPPIYCYLSFTYPEVRDRTLACAEYKESK